MKANPRLSDIAAEAEVAVSTVSMALANHPDISTSTKDKIRATCDKLGYTGRRKRANKARRFIFCLVDHAPEDDGYAPLVFQLAAQAASENDRLEVAVIHSAASTFEGIRSQAGVDGVLILCGLVPVSLLDFLIANKLPAILLGQSQASSAGQRVPEIVFDNIGIGQAATRWLLDRGHERIGFVCGTLYDGFAHAQIRDGYRLECLAAGAVFDQAWEAVASRHADGFAGIAQEVLQLAERPSAWVIPNPADAAGFIAAMESAGAPVALDTVAMADTGNFRHRYQLANRTAFCGRLHEMADTAIDIARRLADGEAVTPVRTIINFDCHTAADSHSSTRLYHEHA